MDNYIGCLLPCMWATGMLDLWLLRISVLWKLWMSRRLEFG